MNQGSTAISVRRTTRWVGNLRRVEVQIDGQTAGKLQSGEEQSFSVNTGEHSVLVRSPWLTSNTLTVAVDEGAAVQLDYEDNSKVNFVGIGICGGLMGLLAPCLEWLGLPSILPWFAAAACVFGGYILLEKLGLLPPMTRYESLLEPRKPE